MAVLAARNVVAVLDGEAPRLAHPRGLDIGYPRPQSACIAGVQAAAIGRASRFNVSAYAS